MAARRKVGKVEQSVRRNLRDLGCLTLAEAEVALRLAGLLDSPDTPATAATQAGAKIVEILESLRERSSSREASPLDEIRERRRARLADAEADGGSGGGGAS